MNLKFIHKLERYGRSLLQFFLPQYCEICGKEDSSAEITSLCKDCLKENLEKYPNDDPEYCKICRTFLSGEKECKYCESRNVFFETAYFLLRRKEIEKNLMNQLKLNNKKHCSVYFAMGLGPILLKIRALKPLGIVPVPSHKSSWTKRPYFATNCLLLRLARKLQIPILPILEKVSDQHQSTQNRKDRFFHAKEAFQLKKNARIINKPTLVLIDDVFTTGASSNEIARLLLQNGAGSVVVISTTRKTEGIEI